MDRDKLNAYRKSLSAQQQKAFAEYHQATGAIALIDALLSSEEEAAPDEPQENGTA